MTLKLKHVHSSIEAGELAAILERDGAAVVHEALTREQTKTLNAELDDVVAKTAPGLRHPSHEDMIEFYGQSTIRLDGLPARSKTFRDIMLSPLMCGLADELLLPNCADYLLNTGQLIQIGPGETAQRLHRDEDAWSFYQPPKPVLEVEAMFALTDFTIENGATQVVPGSHKWAPDRQAKSNEILPAEMPAGSALCYLGSMMHGGGANTTIDGWRRGMFFGYVVGWLRTEENTFLTVPIDQVKKMPTRVQELLGYKAHRAIGVVDVGSPMELLSD
jgi:ectoine hydroxylase-related dioxygenase (phytanoyl-CoA dioxygenase family)